MLCSPPAIQHDKSPATWQQYILILDSGISLISVKEEAIIKFHLHILCTKGTSCVNGVKSREKFELLNNRSSD